MANFGTIPIICGNVDADGVNIKSIPVSLGGAGKFVCTGKVLIKNLSDTNDLLVGLPAISMRDTITDYITIKPNCYEVIDFKYYAEKPNIKPFIVMCAEDSTPYEVRYLDWTVI